MTDDVQPLPQLLVGLGNPGTKYAKTRHNVGFDVLDQLSKRWQISMSEHRKFQGEFGEGFAGPGQKVRLLKPNTYMNRSGQSVRAATDWFKLPPQSVFVIYDDMDLPLGRLRLRLSGSAGGHNGIKSLISHLGTQAFPRLRIGIGAPKQVDADREMVSHVLGKFSPAEAKVLDEVLYLTVKATELALDKGVEAAMNRYNGCSVELP
ncbi:MAG: aminoacyl-tRNA hydrolase [Elainellaceae cyanobacterium]